MPVSYPHPIARWLIDGIFRVEPPAGSIGINNSTARLFPLL
jgi:hypothetical protein